MTAATEARPRERTFSRLRVSRQAGASVAELALYVGVALLTIWPVTTHLATRIVGSGDAEAYVWINWRISEMIASLQLLPTVIPDAVWPYGSGLLTSDGYLPVYIGALLNLVMPPVLAFNTAVIVALVANMLSARTLAQRFSDRRDVWIVVAIAFATAPAIAIRLNGHYTFIWAFTVPLLLAWGVDIARGQRAVKPVALGLLLYAAYLCSVFYLVFGGLAYAIVIAMSRPRDVIRLAPRVAAALAVTALLMTPFIVERLQLDRDERAAGAQTVLSDEAIAYSADLDSMVVQPMTSRFEIPGIDRVQFRLAQNIVEKTTFPGYLLLLGFGALVVLRTRLRLPLLVTAVVIWLMTLGPSLRVDADVVLTDQTGGAIRWLPFALLHAIPGLGMMRTPNRASFTLAAVLAAGLAVGLHWLLSHVESAAGRVATLTVCGLVLITNLVTPINWASVELSNEVEHALKEVRERARGDESVVFLPADCFDSLNNNGPLQIEFRQPMLGCQANFASIPWYSGIDEYVRSKPLAGLRCNPPVLGKRHLPQYPPSTFIDRVGMRELHENLDVRFYILDKQVALDPQCGERIWEIVRVVESNAELLGEDARWAVYDAFPARS